MNISPLATIASMNIGSEQEELPEGYGLVPKVMGPRRLLMNMLRQDPNMAEMLKKIRLGGQTDGSMEPDYNQQG